MWMRLQIYFCENNFLALGLRSTKKSKLFAILLLPELLWQVSHLNAKIAEDCEEMSEKDKDIEKLKTKIDEKVR